MSRTSFSTSHSWVLVIVLVAIVMCSPTLNVSRATDRNVAVQELPNPDLTEVTTTLMDRTNYEESLFGRLPDNAVTSTLELDSNMNTPLGAVKCCQTGGGGCFIQSGSCPQGTTPTTCPCNPPI